MSVQGEEITQQDANSEESSLPQNESTDSENQSATAEETTEASAQSEQVPFHEDPKVQEYLERQIKKQTEAYEKRLSEMHQQISSMPKQAPNPKPVSAFIEDLRKVNPAYADYMEQLEQRASRVEELEQRFQNNERAAIVTEYENRIAKLQSEAKLPADVHKFVKDQIDAKAIANQFQSFEQVEAAYKAEAARYTKWLDDVRRDERKKYVTEKTTDSKAPTSQPKGKVPTKTGAKPEFTGDRENDLALIAKRAMKSLKADREI